MIMDNGHLIIGVNPGNQKQIIFEEIGNNRSLVITTELEHEVISLLANDALNTLWAGDYHSNVFQLVLRSSNAWKIQAKYSGLGIGSVQCLSLLGNLLFAGGNYSKVCVINTVDKKVLPMVFETAINRIFSLHICVVSAWTTYLSVTGEDPSYSENKTDLFDVSKFLKKSFAKKIFSNPKLHFYSIRRQFNNNPIIKELPIYNKISKLNKPFDDKF
jgi:hypothetical protein